MENQNATKFRKIYKEFSKLQSNVPRIVGRIAVNFFRDSFNNQGQKINGMIKPWEPRKSSPKRRKGRKLLIDRGMLRRGLIIKSTTNNKVVIGMDAITSPYAKLQNDGGNIKVTLKMRKFFWAMWFDTKDEFWKGMAMTKKQTINITARPFIYDSPDLGEAINKDLSKRISIILNNA